MRSLLIAITIPALCSCGGDDTEHPETPTTTAQPAEPVVNPHLINNGVQVIEGVIGNSPLRSVILQEVIPPADPQLPPKTNMLGRTTLDGNDSFRLEVQVKEPLLATLSVGPGHEIQLILQGGRVQVTADYEGWNERQVSGDRNNTTFNGFTRTFERQRAALEEYQMRLGRNQPTPDQQQELRKRMQEIESYMKAFIDTTECLGCGVHVLRIIEPTQNTDLLREFRDKLAHAWRGSKYLAEIDARLAPTMKWIGQLAPEIRLSDPDGKVIPLSSLRGKYVLLDFWASWCMPCRQENPNVVKLYNKYRNRGFTVYSVSLDGGNTRTGKTEWVAAIKADRLSWSAHVSDLQGWQSPVAQAYEVSQIPMSFLLDREGRIIAKDLRGDALARKLQEIFGS